MDAPKQIKGIPSSLSLARFSRAGRLLGLPPERRRRENVTFADYVCRLCPALETAQANVVARRGSGGQVVLVRPPLFPGSSGSDPLAQAGTQSIEAAPELVAVPLHRIFERQVRQPAPGQASKQVPDRPLRKPP